MKKLFSICILLIMVTGSAMALPSYSGLRGLNRVIDARTAEPGILSVGLFGFLGLSPDERTAELTSGTTEVTDTEYNGTGYINFGVALGDRFEIGTSISYLMNQLKRDNSDGRLNTSGDWNGDDGFSELDFSLKYTFNPNAESFWFGLRPHAQFSVYGGGDNNFVYNGDEWDGIWHMDEPMFQLRRPMINSGEMSFGGDLLATWALDAFTLHGNLGFQKYSQNFTFTDHRYGTSVTEDVDLDIDDNVITALVGIEYPISKATLFAEVEWRRFLDRDFEEGNGQRFDDYIQVAPGARFTFDSGFAMDITGSYCISSFDPEYNDLGHRRFQQGQVLTDEERARYAPFPGGYAPKYGLGINLMYGIDIKSYPTIISGTVIDEATGEALEASVTFPGAEVAAVTSNAASGVYTVQLDKGSYNMLVAADGYISENLAIEVPSGEEIIIDFALQSAYGTVTGVVSDAGSGLALDAQVAASSTVDGNTNTSGEYSIECPAGTRTFTASSAGYSNQSRTVEIVAGGTVTQDFDLGIVLNFENVYFDTARFTIRPDAALVLDEIAAMLESNPGVTVMITGNTDSDGSPEYNQELADKRADAVRNYLISQGVSENALQTVGYGEDRPAVPNDTNENKALNRRSEFTILAAPIQ